MKDERLLGKDLFADNSFLIHILLYCVDRCFDHGQENAEVYDATCAEIIMGALSGINGTVFMYGQTGAGKTYTMLGDAGIKDRHVNLQKI